MNLPNQITVGRFVLAVIFLVLLAAADVQRRDQQRLLFHCAFWLFVVAGSTDWLDGYLARRQNQITAFGRILDPFVDKILVIGGFILLMGDGFRDAAGRNVTGLAAWMVVVIVARELLVSGLRGFSEAKGRAYAANWWGKIKMVLQSLTVGWIIGSVGPWPGVGWIMACRPYLIWATVLFTAASVVAYLAASREDLAEQSRG